MLAFKFAQPFLLGLKPVSDGRFCFVFTSLLFCSRINSVSLSVDSWVTLLSPDASLTVSNSAQPVLHARGRFMPAILHACLT